MKKRNVLILLFLSLLACKNTKQDKNEEKFDKTKWVTKNNLDYPYRNEMLKDLVYNTKLKGLKQDEVFNLLSTSY